MTEFKWLKEMRRKEEETGISAVSSEGKKHSHAETTGKTTRRTTRITPRIITRIKREREREREELSWVRSNRRRKKEEVLSQEAQELHEVKDKQDSRQEKQRQRQVQNLGGKEPKGLSAKYTLLKCETFSFSAEQTYDDNNDKKLMIIMLQVK